MTLRSGMVEVLRHRDFARFLTARLSATVGLSMQTVAISLQVYAITGDPFHLGLVGLAQFLPAAGLVLVVGHVADRFDRRRIAIAGHAVLVTCSLLLLVLAMRGSRNLYAIYGIVVVAGAAFAHVRPAMHALMPTLVPLPEFPTAVTANSTLWQGAVIVGPALGGWVYARAGGAATVYAVDALCGLFALAALFRIRARREPTVPDGAATKAISAATLLAGIRYVRENRVVLGAISLDLFAVLLGGAVALLPVYAEEILHVGAVGFGWLKAAPGVGAVVMGLVLAHRPPLRRAGATMLGAVALFGVLTVVFGLSRSFSLSLACLALMGAADMVSVVVRQTLVQVATPDAMRGRVSAVSLLFIGASNELGAFESGLTAKWFGTVPAVVLGGVGTVVCVVLWAVGFPELRRVRSLVDAAAPAEGSP